MLYAVHYAVACAGEHCDLHMITFFRFALLSMLCPPLRREEHTQIPAVSPRKKELLSVEHFLQLCFSFV